VASSPPIEAPRVIETIVTAPHVATLVMLDASGTTVAAGGVIGRMALLDETIDLVSDTGGTIVAHRAAPGALIEYGQPIVTIAA
jgi:acetyl-CoA carboxylase biotin carboxyl carrier protein